VPFER
jgi:hypothetical protein